MEICECVPAACSRGPWARNGHRRRPLGLTVAILHSTHPPKQTPQSSMLADVHMVKHGHKPHFGAKYGISMLLTAAAAAATAATAASTWATDTYAIERSTEYARKVHGWISQW